MYTSPDQGSSTRYLHDGHSRIAEYRADGTPVARFVFGPGIDEPLVEYSGTGLTTKIYLHADERGSIIAGTNDSGNATAIGRYDELNRSPCPPDMAADCWEQSAPVQWEDPELRQPVRLLRACRTRR